MYILSSTQSQQSDDWYKYVIDAPVNSANLLTNKVFLQEFSWLFEEGVTGYRIDLVDEENDTWKMTVQYLDWEGNHDETELYLIKVTYVNSGRGL